MLLSTFMIPYIDLKKKTFCVLDTAKYLNTSYSPSIRMRMCVCVCAKSLQSCPTLCNCMDCSPPGSSAHGDSPGKNSRVGGHFLVQGIIALLEHLLEHLLFCALPNGFWTTLFVMGMERTGNQRHF